MKRCPYCAEDIQEEAVKCKHCGEWLEAKRPPSLPTEHQVEKGATEEDPLDREKIVDVSGQIYSVVSFGTGTCEADMRKQGKVLPYAGVCDWIFTEQHLFVLNSTLRSSIGQMPGLVFAVIGEIVNKIKDVRNRKALDLRAAVDLSIQRAGTYAELADLKCLINPIQSTLGDRLTPGNWIFMPHYSRATFSGRFNFGGKEVEGEVSHIFSDKARTSYKGYKEAFPQIGNIELSDEIVPRHWIGCKGIS